MSWNHIQGLAKPAFWSTLAVILVMSLVDLSDTSIAESNDKLNHLLAFFTLAMLAQIAYATVRWKVRAGGLLAYGALIEILQAGTAYRDFSLLDLVADGAGIALFSLGYLLISQLRLKSQTACVRK